MSTKAVLKSHFTPYYPITIDKLPTFIVIKILEYVWHADKVKFLQSVSLVSKAWNSLAYHPSFWKQEINLLKIPNKECAVKGFKKKFLDRISNDKTDTKVRRMLEIFNNISVDEYFVNTGGCDAQTIHYLIFNKRGENYDSCTIGEKKGGESTANSKRRLVKSDPIHGAKELEITDFLKSKFENLEPINFVKELERTDCGFQKLQENGYLVKISWQQALIKKIAEEIFAVVDFELAESHKDCTFYLALTDHRCQDLGKCERPLLLPSKHKVDTFKAELSRFINANSQGS